MTLLEVLKAGKPFFAAGTPDEIYFGIDDHGGILKLTKSDDSKIRLSLSALLFDGYESVESKVTITRTQFWRTVEGLGFTEKGPNNAVNVHSLARALGLEAS